MTGPKCPLLLIPRVISADLPKPLVTEGCVYLRSESVIHSSESRTPMLALMRRRRLSLKPTTT
jgi:hypothetical protein